MVSVCSGNGVAIVPELINNGFFTVNYLTSHYRPISLLSSLGKLPRKAILVRMQEKLDTLDVISDEEHGFRAAHSATHQLMQVVEHITTGNNWRKCTGPSPWTYRRHSTRCGIRGCSGSSGNLVSQSDW